MDPRMYPLGAAQQGASRLVGVFRKTVTVDLASVAANTTAEQNITVTGAQVGDTVIVEAASGINAGLGVVNARVASANTVALRMINATGSAIDAASATWYVTLLRFGN